MAVMHSLSPGFEDQVSGVPPKADQHRLWPQKRQSNRKRNFEKANI
jgi:hypothetical protein